MPAERVIAMVDLTNFDMAKAELIERDSGDEEIVRFHFDCGTTVDVPVRAVAEALNVACRASNFLAPGVFGDLKR